MDGFYRHQGSPHADEPICEKVSQVLCQHEDISVHVSTFWAGNFTQRVYQAPASCSAVTEVTRGPSSCLSRQLKDVDSLLEKGAIEPILGFFSRLFLVPKRTGDLCPVMDLSTLNRHLVVPHFQMEMAQTVRAAIRQNEWTVSIDIKDLHMLMSQSVRKCLRFCVNMKTYQFMCLPFGLATSPRECTKLLHPVVQLLRLQGVHLHVYLDNWLIRADSPQMATSNAQLVIRVLQHLGWIINFEKSELTPTQEFDFIGIHFRTQDSTVAPVPKM